MRGKLSFMMICIAILMMIVPSIVGAHAYMDRSAPSQESELDESPAGIWVEFTEPINTTVSQMRLENEAGEVVGAEQYSIDNLSITLRLDEPLEDGLYTVYWQVLSLDTHVTDGSYRFSLNEELPPLRPEDTIAITDITEQGDQGWIAHDRWNMGMRMIDVLAVMFIGGWLFFHGFLWNKQENRLIQNNRLASGVTERNVYLFGFFLFIFTTLGHMISRSMQLTQTTIGDPLLWETTWTLMTTSLMGIAFLFRPVILGLLVALRYRSKPGLFYKSLLVLALLVSFGLTGHAVHTNMVVPHTIHMLAIVVWLGGLVGFAVYSFRMKTEPESLLYIHDRLKRFSTIALIMVLLVTVTGIVLSRAYLESFNDLFATGYGTILLWKLGLFSFILVIAAFHRVVWLPNVKKVDSSEEKGKQLVYLFWGVRVELFLVVMVLLIAAMLSTASPPVDIHEHHHLHEH